MDDFDKAIEEANKVLNEQQIVNSSDADRGQRINKVCKDDSKGLFSSILKSFGINTDRSDN